MDVDRLAKAYIALREARSALKAEFEEKYKTLGAKQERLEAEMLKFLQENNSDSVKTSNGTIYRQEELTPSGSDWEVFYNWVAENEAFDALERRIKKTFVKEYMEAHDGAPPPGVSVYREYVVRVRRS